MTTQEIIDYYANLLILQYIGKPKAYASVQALVKLMVMDQLPFQVENGFNLIGPDFAVGKQLDILGKYAGVTRTGNNLSGNPVTLDDASFITLIQVATFTNASGSSLSDIQNLLHTFFPNQIFVYDTANMQLSYLIASSVGSQDLVNLFVTEGLLPKPMGVQLSSVVYLPTLDLFGLQDYRSVPPAWSSATTYSKGNRVFEMGIVYESKVTGNTNHVVTDIDFWQPLVYPLNSYATYPTFNVWHWLSYSDGVIIV